MAARTEVDVGGRRLAIGNLERVVFPRTGTTKGEVLDYYARVADAMLPHLRDRLLHMHRYPEGVEGPRFWQKGCPEHKPEWVPTTPVWSREKRADIDYCVRATALDALREGFQVTVDTAGSRGIEAQPGDVERALEEVRAAGGAVD